MAKNKPKLRVETTKVFTGIVNKLKGKAVFCDVKFSGGVVVSGLLHSKKEVIITKESAVWLIETLSTKLSKIQNILSKQ